MKRRRSSLAGLVSVGLGLFTIFSTNGQSLPITAGLQLWLKADAGVTTNASGQVTGWADQSGQANNASQGTVANSPTVALNSLNGKPTLRFASGQFMEVPNANGIAALSNDVTVITVAKYDDQTSYRGVISKALTSGFPAPFDWWNNNSQNSGLTAFYLNGPTSAPRFNSTMVPPIGQFNVLSFRWKDLVADMFLNDFPFGGGTYSVMPTNGPNPLRIGRRLDGTSQLVGNVAEVLIYQPALSNADLYTVINTYLQPKYALVFDAAPAVAITSPTTGSSVAQNTAVPTDISVSDADGYIRQLRVIANGLTMATATAAGTNSSLIYHLNLTAAWPGVLNLTAIATDDYGRSITSAPVVLNITGVAAPTAPLATGLKLWLNAESGLTTNSAGAVTTWSDQSGNGNDAVQTDETAAPVWFSDVVNGKPAVRFTTNSTVTAKFLEVNEPGTAFTTGDFTTFAVARFSAGYSALRQHVWSKCAAGVAGPVDWWFNTTSGTPFGYRGDGTYFAGTGGGFFGPTVNTFNTVGMEVTAADGVMDHYLGSQWNGESVALTNTASAGPLRIGRRADGGTQLNGDIAELVIYDSPLSDSDRSNVVSYLAARYNLVQPANVSPGPVVSITSPTNGATFAAPANVTFSASASSDIALLSRVQLFANGILFATLTNPPYQVPLDLLTPGTVTFMAVARDHWGLSSTSSVIATVTGSASTPLVTQGLQLQLAADLGVTTNSAGAVTGWNDQSGNGNNAAPTAETTSPSLVPAVQNGKPVLRFTGANQFLEVPAANLAFMTGDVSTFAIGRFNNFSGHRVIWTRTQGNLAAPLDWYFASGTGNMNTLRGNGTAYNGFAGGPAPAGVFGVTGFTVLGASSTFNQYVGYNNTGTRSTTQPAGDTGQPMRIGRRADGGVQMNGEIAEILVYDRVVTEAERLQIANYLYNKWGVTVVQLANKPPTVSITSPTNNASANAPGMLSVTATASDPDNALAQVSFYGNGLLIATRTAAPYQIPVQLLTPGQVTLSAQAVDIWGSRGTSAPVVVTVTGAGPSAPPSAGIVLWLKPDAGLATNDVDGTVLSWADQSGNGNNAVPDPAALYPAPLIVDDGAGRPAANWNGDWRFLVVPHAPSLALTNDLSLFYRASFDDFATVRPVVSKTDLNLPRPFDYYMNAAGAGVLYRGQERGNAGVASTANFPSGSFVIAGVTVQSSLGSHYLQAVPNGTGTYQYGAEDIGKQLYIGTRDAQDWNMKGSISEILLYNRALTGDDLNQAQSYLAGKYGLVMFQTYTGAPVLQAQKASAVTMQLSWPAGFADYVLEMRTNVAAGTWTAIVTNPPGNQVTLGTTNLTRFFRLRSK